MGQGLSVFHYLIWCMIKLNLLNHWKALQNLSHTHGNTPIVFTIGNWQKTKLPVHANSSKDEHTIYQ